MKYRFLDITGEQIKAGLSAYGNWKEQGEPDAIANLVCEVHLAMCQACNGKIARQVDRSDEKFPSQRSECH